MSIRKIIITALGVLLLFGAMKVSENMQADKKSAVKPSQKMEKSVFVQTVENTAIPISIEASGNLQASTRMELYAEVQGILEPTGKLFKEGVRYNKGDLLMKINNDELFASLQARKSEFQNLITSILADLKLDYPTVLDKWTAYLNSIDINKKLPELPATESDQEKFFITSKNIYSNFYNIQNQEVRLSKYNIYAPYAGVLTEATVTTGALVRSGQRLGEFIQTNTFELVLSVNASFADYLKVGKQVKLYDANGSKSWMGKVSRINAKVNQSTQSVEVYIQTQGKGLKEGMFLEARVEAKPIENAIEIDRKLLIDNKAVYVVKNKQLELLEVQPVHYNKQSVILQNIPDGTQLIAKPIIGGFTGMAVKIINN